MKRCSKCSKSLPLSAFHRDSHKADGYCAACVECKKKASAEYRTKPEVVALSKVRSRKWREANPERFAATVRCATLRKKYGIDSKEYDRLFALQDNRCAICRGTSSKGYGRMHVDHNHKTGKIRGILCQACNVSLGKMSDSPALLRAAADYLENDN